MAFVSQRGYHRHQCKFCAFVWEHHDVNDTQHGDYGAHECPACHRCNWSLGIYEGPLAPVIRNGLTPQGGPNTPIALHPDQLGGTSGQA
jgi:hypothetical protein